MAPTLSEAYDQDDDWTGIASSEERRKIQNRLNQRIYRKKRHLKRLAANDSFKSDVQIVKPLVSGTQVKQPLGVARHQQELRCDSVKDLPIFRYIKEHPVFYPMVMEFMQKAFADWSLNLPRPGNLSTLTRFNTLDALMRNASVLYIPVEFLESDDFNSPFNYQGPQASSTPQNFPADLSPTALQKAVTHHSWLDLFPIPGVRDNILRGIQTGELDEDQLSEEFCCDLLNSNAKSIAPLVIWGDSWDSRNWEFSEEFCEKWSVLLLGCPEVLQTTNYWRGKRGEMKIEFIVN